MSNKFVRGARIKPVQRPFDAAIQAAMSKPLTLAECVFCLMDLRRNHYADVTKPQLLELISNAWDAYDAATKAEVDHDPTPWCSGCGAMRKADCHCGPIAENE